MCVAVMYVRYCTKRFPPLKDMRLIDFNELTVRETEVELMKKEKMNKQFGVWFVLPNLNCESSVLIMLTVTVLYYKAMPHVLKLTLRTLNGNGL